jgi:hypothetical protein
MMRLHEQRLRRQSDGAQAHRLIELLNYRNYIERLRERDRVPRLRATPRPVFATFSVLVRCRALDVRLFRAIFALRLKE